MTIKQAFEYLASECGIGMKNPFIALRNLVEGFSKVADEIDPMPTGDFVKKSGDTMTGPLVVEDDITGEDITGTRFRYVESVLGGSINLNATPSTGEVNIEIPNKSGTLVLSSSVYNYTLSEKKVGTWLGQDLYQKTISVGPLPNNTIKNIDIDENINKIISMHGYGFSDSSTEDWNIFLNDIVPGNAKASVRVYASITNHKLYIVSGDDSSMYDEAYVTIQYTKSSV